MLSKNGCSLRKLLLLITLFVIMGTASAASISAFISPMIQRPSNLVLLTDKDAYYTKETMTIYLINTREETITFRDDAYGLHFEKWADGKWNYLLSIGNPSQTSQIQPMSNKEGYKAAIAHRLEDVFIKGKYRVVSTGEITQDSKIAIVTASKEFEVAGTPTVTTLPLLNVTADKAVYHQGDRMTITIMNQANETITFTSSACGVSFEKWNGASWEFYTSPVGAEVMTPLNAGQKATCLYTLGEQTDKPFPAGKYRVISTGQLTQNGQTAFAGGNMEFTVQ